MRKKEDKINEKKRRPKIQIHKSPFLDRLFWFFSLNSHYPGKSPAPFSSFFLFHRLRDRNVERVYVCIYIVMEEKETHYKTSPTILAASL
jgi:hypothetical protein